MILADGFDEAILGCGVQFNKSVVVYDYPACLAVLMDRDDMTLDEAIEYMDVKVIGAWVGEESPVFLHRGDISFVMQRIEEESG